MHEERLHSLFSYINVASGERIADCNDCRGDWFDTQLRIVTKISNTFVSESFKLCKICMCDKYSYISGTRLLAVCLLVRGDELSMHFRFKHSRMSRKTYHFLLSTETK